MCRIAAVVLLFEVIAGAPSPLRVTINCGSNERDSPLLRAITKTRTAQNKGTFDVNSFCDLIHNAIPKAVQNGKFVVMDSDSDMDQEGYSDTQSAIAIAPPKGYIPKLGLSRINTPKLRIPTIKVPRLNLHDKPLRAPKLGTPMIFKTYRDDYEEQTSAEKLEQFKKGVQKMLHFVKILGQVDQYLTERTKIVIDKLSKTFAE